MGERLDRRRLDVGALRARAAAFAVAVAVPSWGVGTGGTRFARFPGPGEPRGIMDKLDDCGAIHRLTGATPTVSLHVPWALALPADLVGKAEDWALGFDAMNSNTIQDQPGQADFARQLDRYMGSARAIYDALPDDWRLLTEHKMDEPAFYSTVVQDWGTNLLIATDLGEKAFCLVDLGHHAPNVNVEMIVPRLIGRAKLGGFHLNDAKHGDDDLDAGSIDPHRLFLVFDELVAAEGTEGFARPHMLDRSHNVTDPVEGLMASATEVQRAFVQALLVDREARAGFQEGNDALMATATLKRAFRTDVEPILATTRSEGHAPARRSGRRASAFSPMGDVDARAPMAQGRVRGARRRSGEGVTSPRSTRHASIERRPACPTTSL